MSAERDRRKAEYMNCLATISNTLYTLQHKVDTWESRMKAIQVIADTLPLVLRYQVYFKNTEPKVYERGV